MNQGGGDENAGDRGRVSGTFSVNLVSTGNPALSHRLFDKEARTLAAAGIHVRVFAPHPCHEYREQVELVPLPRASGRLTRFFVAPWRALLALRRQPAAVVHIHDFELLQICPVLKLMRQSVIVYGVDEDFANLMLRREWIPRLLRPVVKTVMHVTERALGHSVDGVVAVTASLAAKYPSHRRVAVYNLPPRSFVERAADGAVPPSVRPIDIVHLGVLSSERMDFLAEVLLLVLEQRPAARLRFIGLRAPQIASLRERLGRTEADLLGTIPYRDVPHALRECRVGIDVHPVRYPHLEPALPVKVFEYMAAGCGVVASWLPELDEQLTDEDRTHLALVLSAEPEQYADALARWLDNPALLDTASQHLRSTARDSYTWEREAEKLPALYASLLAAKNV